MDDRTASVLRATAIAAVKLVTPRRFGDARGWFQEVYSRPRLIEAGLDVEFVQDNMSMSAEPGTVRGLHFQVPPCAQAKLIGVVAGAIFDVAVDIRVGSPTYGRHVAMELTPESGQLFVPAGFAHGFCTLARDTIVAYKVSTPYAPEHDRGLDWADPALAIAWPIALDAAILSSRDRNHPRLADLPAHFRAD